MYLECYGKGSPTVVFVSGGGVPVHPSAWKEDFSQVRMQATESSPSRRRDPPRKP
jgi:hypothetical protein